MGRVNGIGRGDALIVTDIQNDFLPGGALAVDHADEVLEPLRRHIADFHAKGLPIFATKDWHPPDHCSFRPQGGPWPVHCVMGTRGAQAPNDFVLPRSTAIVQKAVMPGHEAYSAFDGTGLDCQLRAAGVRRLFIGGLTTDYCVLYTVRDAIRHGYAVVLLMDAIRAVNVHPGDGARAEREMIELGAVPLTGALSAA